MPDIERRDFLKLSTSLLLAACGALGVDALVRFLASQPGTETPTEFDLGSVQEYPVGSTTLFPDIPALLSHNEDDSFSALSLTCTHLGCTVEQARAGFVCPCHGSRYDAQGGVTHGPATERLRALPVTITNEGHVQISSD